jgi:hypothetical protein
LGNPLRLRPYVAEYAKAAVEAVAEVAVHTVKGTVLADTAVEFPRSRGVVLPSAGIVDLLCGEALTMANRRVYGALADRSKRKLLVI